jgi:hypothetical protein
MDKHNKVLKLNKHNKRRQQRNRRVLNFKQALRLLHLGLKEVHKPLHLDLKAGQINRLNQNNKQNNKQQVLRWPLKVKIGLSQGLEPEEQVWQGQQILWVV